VRKNSASLNRRSENVVVEAIIVPELEFRNVKVKVAFAHIVECADDAALKDAPETLNCLGVDSPDDILVLGVVNGAMREFLAKVKIFDPLICAEQATLSDTASLTKASNVSCFTF
jgi:hypothetical protein